MVSLLWYQKEVIYKSSVLSWILYLGLSFFSIHQQYMLFWIIIGHKSYRDNQIGAWNRCCLWLLKHTKKLLVRNQESPELYTHLNQWETIDLSFSKDLMGVKENSCYSVPSLRNSEAYVKQSWYYKIFVIHPDLIFWGKLQNLLWLELITDTTFLM